MNSRRHFMTYLVPKKIVPGFDLTGGFFHGVGLTKRCQSVLENNNDTLINSKKLKKVTTKKRIVLNYSITFFTVKYVRNIHETRFKYYNSLKFSRQIFIYTRPTEN
jgi:hypothetical protein